MRKYEVDVSVTYIVEAEDEDEAALCAENGDGDRIGVSVDRVIELDD